MELSLDIFRTNDAFTVNSLQRVVTNSPYIPTMLGNMQLFENKPIDTEFVIIYEEDGTIVIIPTTERGSPDVMATRDLGRFYALKTVRIAKQDTVRASELLGIANLALPENIRLRNAMDLLNKRTQKLKSDMAATKELHRLGALQGKLLDADGTRVIYDYFDAFGVTQSAFVDVNFSTLAEDDFMMFWQTNILVPMQLALRNRWVEGRTSVAALVGDTFWASLMTHPGIREMWKLEMQAQAIAKAVNPLWQPNNWRQIDFGGITWINYRGSTNGEIAVAPTEARFFPVGATDVFNVYWSPGETLAQVQAEGQPEYLMIQPDVRQNMASHMDVFLRSYPLYACIFPKALMRARKVG